MCKHFPLDQKGIVKQAIKSGYYIADNFKINVFCAILQAALARLHCILRKRISGCKVRAMAKAEEIRCITLNCFGLPNLYPIVHCARRTERIEAIAEFLASHSSSFDLVFLQEVFVEDDQNRITDAVKAGYPFSTTFFGR